MKLWRYAPALLVVILVAGMGSGAAFADTIVEHDAEGRAIHFEVESPDADVGWYASLLGKAAHGDEISTVTIRIVDAHDIHEECGAVAAGCYFGQRTPTLVVPAGRSNLIASIFLHEYGHHLDRAWKVSGVSEPNGTPVWWALRGMGEFRKSGAVKDGYQLGWNRGVGEIFAEDYAYIHVGGRYGIPWLYPPSSKLKQALLAELRGEEITTPPAANIATQLRPVHINDAGTLDAGESHARSFTLLGPGRRVTLTAGLSGVDGTGGQAVVRCNGAVIKSAPLAPGRSATLDVSKLGPGKCSASLVNTGATAQQYSFRLRLAVQI